MKLNLGVVDVAYSDKKAGGLTTTGAVAQLLENRYHVMRLFVEEHHDFILDEIMDAMNGELENRLLGKNPPVRLNTSKIDERFRDFLATGEAERLFPFEIKAATTGQSLRKKKRQYDKARPAFIDTGLYQASFRSWITR